MDASTRKVLAVVVSTAICLVSLGLATFVGMISLFDWGLGNMDASEAVVPLLLSVLVPVLGGLGCGVALLWLQMAALRWLWVGIGAGIILILLTLVSIGVIEGVEHLLLFGPVLVLAAALMSLGYWLSTVVSVLTTR